MADETATAVVEAPVAAPSGSSESAAPAAPATPTTPASPETSAAPEAALPSTDRDVRDFLATEVAKATKALNLDGTKPAEPVKPAEPAKPAEVAKTPEQIAAEKAEADKAKLAEEKPAEEKPAEAEPNPLDKIGPLPVEKLAATLKDNPALAAELEKAGLEPEVLYETARQAALAEQFMDVVPTPDAAKFAVESANHFYDIEERFPQIKTIEDIDKFVMETMLPLSVLRDPNTGEALKNDNGTFKTDGSVERFLKLNTDIDHRIMREQLAPQIIAQGKQMGGEEGERLTTYGEQVQAAIDFIDEFRNNGYRVPGEKPAELPEAFRVELEQARARDQEITQRENQVLEEKAGVLEGQVNTDTVGWLDPLIRDTINSTSLDDYGKKNAVRDIHTAILQRLENHRTFQKQKEAIWAKYQPGKNDDAVRKELVALNKSTTNSFIQRAMQDVLSKAGARRLEAAAKRQDKIDTQIKSDRMNPGSTAAASPTAPPVLTVDEAYKADVEAATAKNAGRPPNAQQILTETLRRQGYLRSA